MEKKIKYYYIEHLDIVGKSEGFMTTHQVFMNGKWKKDDEFLIKDRLMGYDPGEPSDSPYGIGNSDIMDEIQEITEEEAMAIINRQMSKK